MERKHRARTWLITSALVAGTALGAAGVASAATSGTTGSSDSSTSASTLAPPTGAPQGAQQGTPPQGAPQDPSTMTNGPGEELLTGTLAEQVTAKALAEVPGATVIRVETDAHGGKYEAHLKKADGTAVTVVFNEDLSVKQVEDGFGAPPQGAPQGTPPQGSPQAPASTQSAA